MQPDWPPDTDGNLVGNLLGHGLETKPDELALVSARTQLSWRDLAETSDRLSAQYLALGLQPGDGLEKGAFAGSVAPEQG